MMFSWIRKGIRTGVLTTRYPAVAEKMPEGFRGRPVLDPTCCQADQGCMECVQACLPGALRLTDTIADGSATRQLVLDYGRCIMCGHCVEACPAGALQMANDYELATTNAEDGQFVVRFFHPDNHENDEGEDHA